MSLIFLDSCIVIDYINGKLELDDSQIKNFRNLAI